MQLTPEPHEQRVIDERAALDAKIEGLHSFIFYPIDRKGDKPELSERFKRLPKDEQSRMHRQLAVMREYSAIPTERIDAFPLPPGLTRIPSIAELGSAS